MNMRGERKVGNLSTKSRYCGEGDQDGTSNVNFSISKIHSKLLMSGGRLLLCKYLTLDKQIWR